MKIDLPKYNVERFLPNSTSSENFKMFEFDAPSKLLTALENSDVCAEHTHAFYTIFWLDSGVCSQYVDGVKNDINSSSLLLISPFQVHNNSIECTADLSGGVMMFTREFIANHDNVVELLLLAASGNNPLVTHEEDDLASIKSTINSIKREYYHSSVKELILTTLFSALMSQIERVVDGQLNFEMNNQAVETYKKFIVMVEANFKENLSVEEYASSMAMSSKNLNRIIKKIVGLSPSEIIMRRKLLEAQRLLSYSTMSVQQISDELNYTDSSYFNRLYKRAFGVNPSTFRRQKS